MPDSGPSTVERFPIESNEFVVVAVSVPVPLPAEAVVGSRFCLARCRRLVQLSGATEFGAFSKLSP